MKNPRTISLAQAASALAMSERSIANILGATVAETPVVGLNRLAKALSADPKWILDCLERRDFSVTELQARSILGGTYHATPKAHLKKGRRYSALELGLFPVSPPVGHPAHRECGED